MDILKKFVGGKIGPLFKPVTPLDVIKETAAFSVAGTRALDNQLHFTDRIGKWVFNKIGPARPGFVNAVDSVANSAITKTIVTKATEGGLAFKTAKLSYKVGTAVLVDHFHLDDKLLKIIPGPGSTPQNQSTKKITPNFGVNKGISSGLAPKPNPTAAAKGVSLTRAIPNYRLKLPNLGHSLAAIRASSGRTTSPMDMRAWTLKHMTMRNATPTAGNLFSAKHMTIRTAGSPSSGGLKLNLNRPTVHKAMPASRPSVGAFKMALPIKRMAPLKQMAPPKPMAPRPMGMPKMNAPRPMAPAFRGIRR